MYIPPTEVGVNVVSHQQHIVGSKLGGQPYAAPVLRLPALLVLPPYLPLP